MEKSKLGFILLQYLISLLNIKRNFKCDIQIIYNFRLGGKLAFQRLKRLPQMQETRVPSLRREDPLEKEMVTHSSILA